jgi:hypothetical protein
MSQMGFSKKLTINMWQIENDKNHFEMEGDLSIANWANAQIPYLTLIWMINETKCLL